MIVNYDKICEKLVVVNPQKLRRYEELDEKRVSMLGENFLKTQTLYDPIICDLNLELLIDGHHRTEALLRLGIKVIPAYTVSYLSDEVEITPYYKFCACPAEKLLYIIEKKAAKRMHHNFMVNKAKLWLTQDINIVILSRFGGRYVIKALNHIEASLVLHNTIELLALGGYKTTESYKFDWKYLPRKIQSCAFLLPPPGKAEIIKVAHTSLFFPPHVNKHVVKERLVGIKVPLKNLLSTKKEVENGLKKKLINSTPRLIESLWKCHNTVITERYIQI